MQTFFLLFLEILWILWVLVEILCLAPSPLPLSLFIDNYLNIPFVKLSTVLHASVLLKFHHITVKESDSDTIIMVIFLVLGVGGIFILFAIMALCYRFVKSLL